MRAPRSAIAGLLVVLVAVIAALPAAPHPAPGQIALGTAAEVSWEPSRGLVVAEVMTGGASASDEYVEISNAGPVPLDLGAHELVYVTATGATVTRKASWPETLLVEPGRHVLVANALGVHAAAADATYSGGLAAAGGAIVLRRIGGAVVDAVGWGQAAGTFVEGSPAPAPEAGQSIERRPGGAGGNLIDTNDNAADWIIVNDPLPRPLAAPPVPAPITAPTPTATPAPSPEPTPTAGATPAPVPDPTASPVPTPISEPAPSPEPTPSAEPTSAPTTEPSASPAPTPSPVPSAAPEPSASPAPAIPVAAARLALDGARVVVEGVLTTPLGSLEDGRGGFLQDESGGIALLLPTVPPDVLEAGLLVRASGVVDDRYAQRTVRLDGPPDVLGSASLPSPQEIATGVASEVHEGLFIVAEGFVAEAPTLLASGHSLLVDDGSGGLRVALAFDAPSPPARGARLRVAGPLGQRDTSGTGSGGYRVFVTDPSLAQVLPAPTPEASPSPAPEPTPGASPPPSLSPSPSPVPTPAPTPTSAPPVTIATARALDPGGRAFVEGIVTAEAGLLGLPALLAIQDATGGLFVRLPAGAPMPARGETVRLAGRLADPHGQLEIRPAAGDFDVVSGGGVSDPLLVTATQIGEAIEGRLVTIEGVLAAKVSHDASGDATLRLVDATGTAFRARATRASGIATTTLVPGTRLLLTGVVGQRASRKGAPDGYRVWLRDPSDLAVTAAAPTPEPSATPRPSPGDPATGPVEPIAAVLLRTSGPVAVEGVVTTPATLLDATGRRIIVEDSSAAVEVLLPSGTEAPAPGSRTRVAGELGTAYGAPRIRASLVESLGPGTLPRPRPLATEPGQLDEGELVRIEGAVVDVLRFGDRWRAEVRTVRAVLVVAGLTGAGITADTLVEGRRVTVTGVVRRPHPAASDRRFAVVPRDPGDVRAQGPDRRPAAAVPAWTSGRAASQPTPSVPPGRAGHAPSVDLADLGSRIGEPVRVGGLVAAIGETSIFVDDGTAIAEVRLLGDASPLLPLIEPGDAVGAVGRVVATVSGPLVEVTEPAGVAFLGHLGEPIPIAGAGQSAGHGGPPGGVVSADRLPAMATGEWARSPDPGLGSGTGASPGVAAGAMLGLVGLAALVTAGRVRERRRLAARVARRLAALSEDRPAPRPRTPGTRPPAVRGTRARESA